MFVSLYCAVLSFNMVAQERSDTTYLFHFKPGDDMFYVPWKSNGEELSRLMDCVEKHRKEILEGGVQLHVEGHAFTMDIARIRSNRVKSELIAEKDLVEQCFVTANYDDGKDYVAVYFTVPVSESVETRLAEESVFPQMEEPERHDGKDVVDRQADSVAVGYGSVHPAVEDSLAMSSDSGCGFGKFSVRANLLRWATLTPDLGLEWRISSDWGIAVHGSFTSWSWDDKDRRYALWEIAPEVRYYLGKEKRGYLGAMYKAGGFNYKLSETGRQGDIMGGGITGGYQLRLNDALSLDFNIAVGCLHADYEKYVTINGVSVLRGDSSKNWWGPVNAGVTLVWTLF